MTTYRSTPINAKDVKVALKTNGVKVLRCRDNGKGGILLTIDSKVDNQVKAIEFMAANSLAVSPSLPVKVRVSPYDHIDYGNIFKWVEL